MTLKIIRQGDVYIRLNTGKAEGKPRADRILALGEATGHNHVLQSGHVYGNRGGDQVIVLDAPTWLEHLAGSTPTTEHDRLLIPGGTHTVYIQREYQPRAVPRRVVD
jgi:hypothetical protein